MISIRKRIALSFIFIIVLTVLILEVLILNILKQNYYSNLEDTIKSQLKVSANIYSIYFSDNTLYDNVLNNVDSFWNQTNLQVQIIDTNGKILMDSIGVIPDDNQKMPDVTEALQKGYGTWIGKVPYDDYGVMAVSGLLTSHGEVVGVLRFISSLEQISKDLHDVTVLFAFIGLAVSFVSVAVSIFLSTTVAGPLKEITRVAEKMAKGDFTVHIAKKYNDEIGKLSDTLNFMADEISKRENLKNNFISSVSHELKTPLTSIKGWAATLAEDENDDKELLKEGLGIIEKECDRLTAMVVELLDFSRFLSNKIELEKVSVNIEELMNHVARQLAPRADREGIDLQVQMQKGLPDIEIDPNRLKQVFINVLDNAFKFNKPGGKVFFTAVLKENSVVFEIKDTGCGIDPSELPTIKEKFVKGKHSQSGSGLGLSISDEIIRLMGGTLDIESVLNEGTTVTITLPVKKMEGK